MNRAAFTLIFIVAATFFNLLLSAFFFVLILVLYRLSLGQVPGLMGPLPTILGSLALALVATGFVYKHLLRWAKKRWRLEERLSGRRS